MVQMTRVIQMMILFAALLLAGCALPPPPTIDSAAIPVGNESTDPEGVTDSAALLGVEWRLAEIHPANAAVLMAGDPLQYTISFTADGSFGGQLSCNNISGDYKVVDGKLLFGSIASTMAFCPEDDIITPYTQALNSVLSFAVVDGRLIVTYGPDGGELVYLPVAPVGEGELSAASESSASVDVTEAALANGNYPGIYDEPVTLTDGVYAGEPFVAGGASRPTVNLQPNATAVGDLNGDGMADGVAVLVENSGGSGSFVYLAALLAEKDAPATGVTLLLGDRVRVESVAIVNGQIEVVAATFADNDPQCCPSLRTHFVYGLEQGALLELSAEKL